MSYDLLEREQSIGRAPLPAEPRFFASQGYVQLDGLWSASFAEGLQREAKGAGLDVPLLTHLHFSLVPLVRAVSGLTLVPSVAAYQHFGPDAGGVIALGDAGGHDGVVLLATVLGDPGPLYLQGELPVRHPRHGVTALRSSMTHHRPARPGTRPSAVAELRYRSLF